MERDTAVNAGPPQTNKRDAQRIAPYGANDSPRIELSCVQVSSPASLTTASAVNAIARILANVDRKRLGYQSIVLLDDLEHQDASYYREQAAMAIKTLERGRWAGTISAIGDGDNAGTMADRGTIGTSGDDMYVGDDR